MNFTPIKFTQAHFNSWVREVGYSSAIDVARAMGTDWTDVNRWIDDLTMAMMDDCASGIETENRLKVARMTY